MKFSTNDVKRITIQDLKALESGNSQQLKQFAEDIQIVRNNSSKIKFELSTESFTK